MKLTSTSKASNIVSDVLDSLKNQEPVPESNNVSGATGIVTVSTIRSEKADLIRIDKNIAKNIDILTENKEKTKGLSNEDKNLIKNIIYFLCLKRQNDIFGFGRLDSYEFANMFGYNPISLKKKHENPIQLNGLSDEEKERLYLLEKEDFKHHIYDSVFENALYWLHTNVLQFKRGAKDAVINNEKITFIESKSYVLLPEISIYIRKEGKKKHFYTYTVDANFITNLSLYYLNCNKLSLISLRQSGLDDLYLFLSNVRASIVEQLRNSGTSGYKGSLNFEFLCDIAQIKRFTKESENIPPKKRKQQLVDALKKINEETELQFEVTWQKKTPTDRWSYLPMFDFKIRKEELFSHADNKVIIDEKGDIFRQNLGHELWNVFKRFSIVRDEEEFFKWLKDNNRNLKEKDMAYRNANFNTYGKLYTFIDATVASWLKKLPAITSMDNIAG